MVNAVNANLSDTGRNMSEDMTKPTVTVQPAKTRISLGIRPV